MSDNIEQNFKSLKSLNLSLKKLRLSHVMKKLMKILRERLQKKAQLKKKQQRQKKQKMHLKQKHKMRLKKQKQKMRLRKKLKKRLLKKNQRMGRNLMKLLKDLIAKMKLKSRKRRIHQIIMKAKRSRLIQR